jgi:hypothetical protein
MSKLDVLARAYELLETSLAEDDRPAAASAVLADLEVLPREELVRIAMVVVVEATHTLAKGADRVRLRDQVALRRAALPWAEELP